MTLSLSTVQRSCAPAAPRTRLVTYFTVWAERRALAGLSPQRLRDLGLGPVEVAREVARPFWDISGTRGH